MLFAVVVFHNAEIVHALATELPKERAMLSISAAVVLARRIDAHATFVEARDATAGRRVYFLRLAQGRSVAAVTDDGARFPAVHRLMTACAEGGDDPCMGVQEMVQALERDGGPAPRPRLVQFDELLSVGETGAVYYPVAVASETNIVWITPEGALRKAPRSDDEGYVWEMPETETRRMSTAVLWNSLSKHPGRTGLAAAFASMSSTCACCLGTIACVAYCAVVLALFAVLAVFTV
ncbi:MAG TPA: hypothetical protein VKD22_03400 [Ramlibacter sp.]|nr:hypothetical protein [Ramlibacter sp.]